MKVAIFGRNCDKGFKEYINKFFKILIENNIEFIIYDKFYEFLKREIDLNLEHIKLFSKPVDIKNEVDLLFSIGGDGTILDATTIVQDSKIPIVGINTGKLGIFES